VLGANSRKEGYVEGNGWPVTMAFGYLVELPIALRYLASEAAAVSLSQFQLRFQSDVRCGRRMSSTQRDSEVSLITTGYFLSGSAP
jgi:hypothetical protein